MKPGSPVTVLIPIVIDPVEKPGDVVGGGCVDEALDPAPSFDGVCGGDSDVPLPSLTVAPPEARLTIVYTNGTLHLRGRERRRLRGAGPAARLASQLWLTLAIAAGTKPGTYTIPVTVTTTTAEGDTSDNTAVVPLVVHATGSNGTGTTVPVKVGDGLAVTGPQVALLVISAGLMIGAGAVTLVATRRRCEFRYRWVTGFQYRWVT